MSLEFWRVKLGGFCPTGNGKDNDVNPSKETFPGTGAVNRLLFCAATVELEGYL